MFLPFSSITDHNNSCYPPQFSFYFPFNIFLHTPITSPGRRTGLCEHKQKGTVGIGEINLTEIYLLHRQQLLASMSFVCTSIVQVFPYAKKPAREHQPAAADAHIKISMSAETRHNEDHGCHGAIKGWRAPSSFKRSPLFTLFSHLN